MAQALDVAPGPRGLGLRPRGRSVSRTGRQGGTRARAGDCDTGQGPLGDAVIVTARKLLQLPLRSPLRYSYGYANLSRRTGRWAGGRLRVRGCMQRDVPCGREHVRQRAGASAEWRIRGRRLNPLDKGSRGRSHLTFFYQTSEIG